MITVRRTPLLRHALTVFEHSTRNTVTINREYVQHKYRYFSSNNITDDVAAQTDPELTALLKNPIVQQLWKARQESKKRQDRGVQKLSDLPHPTTKTPDESRVTVNYPFSTSPVLLETYKNPWSQMRFGKLMEDMDALAGNIAFFHVDQGQTQHPTLVTASFDRIRLKERPAMGPDLELSGQVVYTGTSSLEIRLQCREQGNDHCWLEAFVTYVTLDPETRQPLRIAALQPVSLQDQHDFDAGLARATLKKKRRQESLDRVHPDADALAMQLLQQASPLINLPSLADPHSILMRRTRIQNAQIAQPQMTNLQSRIFGGFLMRRAFELAFSNAYMFGGSRPVFLETDEVSFTKAVNVGDLLVFNSRVIYTNAGRLSDYYENMRSTDENQTTTERLMLVHVEVECWVTEPETVKSTLSNQFYFTFAIVNKPVRNVLPGTMDEARRMAIRMLHDKAQRNQPPVSLRTQTDR
jgi:acyl-coenzyme A thioesterase 9